MYIYQNGSIVEKEKAVISPFDHGYLYGVGLFETFRVYSGHPFLLDDHLTRLNQGCLALGIMKQFTRQSVLDVIRELLHYNHLSDAYVRLNVSAGIGDVGLHADPYYEPTEIMFMKQLPTFPDIKSGITLSTRRNTPEGKHRLKSHHFLNNVYAKREVGNNPLVEGIFLSEDGFVAEGITSNLFWLKNGVLYTPSLYTGILNGITRQYILSKANDLGLEVKEGLFTINEVEQSESAFLTNSIQEIVQLKEMNDHSLVVNHPIIIQLKQIYRDQRQLLWSKDEQ